MKNTQRGHCT